MTAPRKFLNPPLVNGGLYRAITSAGLPEEGVLMGRRLLHDGRSRGTLYRDGYAPQSLPDDDPFWSRWELYAVPAGMVVKDIVDAALAAGFDNGALPLTGSHFGRDAQIQRAKRDLQALQA